jgi:hypothetical protein
MHVTSTLGPVLSHGHADERPCTPISQHDWTMTKLDRSGLVLRPSLPARVVGCAVAVLGVVFAASGLVDPNDTQTLITMALAGLVMTAVGVSLATAAAHVSPEGIRYQSGLLRKYIPAADISGISVGPGSGAPPPRLTYIVHRLRGRSVRLVGVQLWRSKASADQMQVTARVVERVLGLPGA